MNVRLKILRIGNSLGVVLPAKVLIGLKVRVGDPVYLSVSGAGAFRLTAREPEFSATLAAVDECFTRFRNALGGLVK